MCVGCKPRYGWEFSTQYHDMRKLIFIIIIWNRSSLVFLLLLLFILTLNAYTRGLQNFSVDLIQNPVLGAQSLLFFQVASKIPGCLSLENTRKNLLSEFCLPLHISVFSYFLASGKSLPSCWFINTFNALKSKYFKL